jgi:hypothetical protein
MTACQSMMLVSMLFVFDIIIESGKNDVEREKQRERRKVKVQL